MTPMQEIEDQVQILRGLQAESWPTGLSRDIVYRRGKVPLSQYVRAEAKARPDAPMIHYYGRTLSWKDVDTLSDQFASLLQSRGVGAGDRVALMMGNCPQFTICFWGIMKRGAVLVPVNPMFKEIELAYQLNDSGAETLVFQDDLAPLVANVLEDTSVRVTYATGAAEMAGQGGAVPRPDGMGLALPADGGDRLLAALDESGPFNGPDCSDVNAVAALNYTGAQPVCPRVACIPMATCSTQSHHIAAQPCRMQARTMSS
ncbi:hypothetical protein LCGC14_2689740 [marine sediment metagenome]|uniref:AMP-dependent synthetase/ligase domain-containing protein n=1 Tax=marine sediment metagenome TaxID=412755 RepID=A0A0F8ZIW1_9ZZZZ